MADVDPVESLCRLHYVLVKEVDFIEKTGGRVAYKQCPGTVVSQFITLSFFISSRGRVQSSNGSALDCWPTGRAIDPAPGA